MKKLVRSQNNGEVYAQAVSATGVCAAQGGPLGEAPPPQEGYARVIQQKGWRFW